MRFTKTILLVFCLISLTACTPPSQQARRAVTSSGEIAVSIAEENPFVEADPTSQYTPRTRTYYIAAEEVEWDYAPSGKDLIKNKAVPHPWGMKTEYEKVRYIEYTDGSFKTKKEQPEWLGIMGPVIRAVEGDVIRVAFKNKASKPYSIHPHGVFYTKDNEGAGYSGIKGKGSAVEPGDMYIYTWTAHKKSAPGLNEGGSKVWLYHSHVDSVSDMNEGLIGPMIITSAKYAHENALPKDVDREFVTLYMIFNEEEEPMHMMGDMMDHSQAGGLMHAMNGYIFGNLQGFEMDKDDKVRWHLLAMGGEMDLHTAHWHGESVEYDGRYEDVIELLPASMKTVDMVAENPGTWLYHCHVTDHITAGMVSTYTIND